MNTDTATEVPTIPVEDFFKNPEMSYFQISPDGKHYSYTAPWENRMNIFVKEVGSDKATRITGQKDRDISGYFWANDNRIVYLKDDNGDENFYLVAVDPNGENLKPLTQESGVRSQIIDELEDDRTCVSRLSVEPSIGRAVRLRVRRRRVHERSRRAIIAACHQAACDPQSQESGDSLHRRTVSGDERHRTATKR